MSELTDPGSAPESTDPVNQSAPTPIGRPGFGGRAAAVVAAVVSGGVLLILAVVYLVDLLSTGGKIDRNTTIAGVPVGGLTPEQAITAVSEQALPGYADPVAVDVHGEETVIDPVDAGLTADVEATVQSLGVRSGNPLVRFGSFFGSTEVPLSVRADETRLTAYLDRAAASTDVRPVEGTVQISGSSVRATQPVTGRNLDVAGSAVAVTDAWTAGGPDALRGLVLPVTSVPVRATAEAVRTAAAEATALLAAPLRLVGKGAVVEVPIAAIAGATSVAPDEADGFRVSVDATALRGPYIAAVEATQSEPADARIAISEGAPVVTPAVPGRTVDWTATESAIDRALRTDGHRAVVAYVEKAPALTTAEAKALGIREVIGEFTTGGFAAASGENIRVVAQRVNGAIVRPGATFGLNEFTGTRGAEQGYVPAAIIQEGALSTAVGGGISQFATTLYNAAYFAGMGDVTHTPHSFYISRYPPGREATVFDGEIELAFSNDYPTGVLIETIWTEGDITVRLWGTKHVEVESRTTDRFDLTSPQVVVKPFGESCVPSDGSTGFTVVNTRIITNLAGKELRGEDFTTVYNGQQNVVCAPDPSGAATANATATTQVAVPGG